MLVATARTLRHPTGTMGKRAKAGQEADLQGFCRAVSSIYNIRFTAAGEVGVNISADTGCDLTRSTLAQQFGR